MHGLNIYRGKQTLFIRNDSLMRRRKLRNNLENENSSSQTALNTEPTFQIRLSGSTSNLYAETSCTSISTSRNSTLKIHIYHPYFSTELVQLPTAMNVVLSSQPPPPTSFLPQHHSMAPPTLFTSTVLPSMLTSRNSQNVPTKAKSRRPR
jgi:hypothetical protein